jgi:hypothetical protein
LSYDVSRSNAASCGNGRPRIYDIRYATAKITGAVVWVCWMARHGGRFRRRVGRRACIWTYLASGPQRVSDVISVSAGVLSPTCMRNLIERGICLVGAVTCLDRAVFLGAVLLHTSLIIRIPDNVRRPSRQNISGHAHTHCGAAQCEAVPIVISSVSAVQTDRRWLFASD